MLLWFLKSPRFLKKMINGPTPSNTWSPTQMTWRSSRLRWRPRAGSAKSAKLLKSLRRHDVRAARTRLLVPCVPRDPSDLRSRLRILEPRKFPMFRRFNLLREIRRLCRLRPLRSTSPSSRPLNLAGLNGSLCMPRAGTARFPEKRFRCLLTSSFLRTLSSRLS